MVKIALKVAIVEKNCVWMVIAFRRLALALASGRGTRPDDVSISLGTDTASLEIVTLNNIKCGSVLKKVVFGIKYRQGVVVQKLALRKDYFWGCAGALKTMGAEGMGSEDFSS